MIGEKTVLAIIPARGGSKGVPRKNIREVAGKPLIAWTIEEAKKSKYIDRLILSSDDAEIIAIAREWGCEVPFVRPAELAKDETPGIASVLHAIKSLPGYDYAVLLQPTSPLRTFEDIDGCMELCVSRKASACVSVSEPDKNPYWMFTIDSEDKLRPLMGNKAFVNCRQDLPKVYALNGAVYVGESDSLVKHHSFFTDNTVSYVMSKQASVDIDTEYDILLLNFIISKL